jgi:hypothetical protein
LARKSTIIAVIDCQVSTRQRSMQRAATSRSQRASTTIVAPAYSGPFMLQDMPVTWKKGSGDR